MVASGAELKVGRTFALTLGHCDDFFVELTSFCRQRDIRCGYIPLFLGAFRTAKVVGTCEPADGEVPILDLSVDLQFVEVVGAGTVAFDDATGDISPHVHLSLGQRLDGARGATSHLFEAQVQFLVELVLVEVLEPRMTRVASNDLFGLKLLDFGQQN